MEPVISVVRFNQARNRLEVLRGMKNVPNRLMGRLLRKYPAINMRWKEGDLTHNVRLFDMGGY